MSSAEQMRRAIRGNALTTLWLILDRAASGVPPTRKEICRAVGCASKNSAQEILAKLEKLGLIRVDRGCSRGIVPTCKFIPVEELYGDGGDRDTAGQG